MWIGLNVDVPVQVVQTATDTWVSRNMGANYWHLYRLLSLGGPLSCIEQFISTGPYSENLPRITVSPYSQIEYAYMADSDDVGGVAHGGETLLSSQWRIGSTDTALVQDQVYSSTSIKLTQTIRSAANGVDLADVTLIHKWRVDDMRITHSHAFLRSANIGWAYPAMMPVAHRYDSDTQFETMELGDQKQQFTDHIGVSNNTRVYADNADRGIARGASDSLGVSIHMTCDIQPQGQASGTSPKQFWQINRSGLNTWSKLYFQASQGGVESWDVVNGTTWDSVADYRCRVSLPKQLKY